MPARAIPVFDFTEAVPVFSQISTGMEQVKNLKDQLTEMKNNLKAIGDKIKNVAAFAKDIADKVVDVAGQVKGAVDDVNGYVNKGRDIVNNVVDKTTEISGTVRDVVDNTVSATEDIVDKKMANLNINREKKVDINYKSQISVPSTEENPSNKEARRKENLVKLREQSEVVSDKLVIRPSKVNIAVPAVKEEDSLGEIGDIIVKPLSTNNDKRIKANLSDVTKVTWEDEVEEEEVSEEETNIKISMVKDNIKIALLEAKDLNVQYNDMLDMSLYTLQKNSELNQKTINEMKELINRAENLTKEEKSVFAQKTDALKDKEKSITNRAIGIIEGVKDSYNREYKNKIEDGYKNYENIAIAYIKGDADKSELQKAGKTLKKNVETVNITPDKLVVNELNKSMQSFQEELKVFANQVKQIEDKSIKAKS